MSDESEQVRTYGEISRRTAEHAALNMLRRVQAEQVINRLRFTIAIKPSRWQRFKRVLSLSSLRWRLADRLHDLAYWIEP
jgi:hypothetical protein